MNIIWKKENEPKMDVITKQGVTYLQFPAFSESGMVRHGFSTRLGGVSEGMFASMNLSFTRGDEPESVMTNYKRLTEAMGMDYRNVVTSDQTHTTNVLVVTGRDRGNGILRPRAYKDVDGMITNEPNIVLTTSYADCVPLYFLDPVHRAIGLSHSGWKGTVGKMGKVTVEAMVKTFGSCPEDILTAIGPSICQDCYEVSEDVIDQFKDQFQPNQYESLFYKKENGKYQLNLWEANRLILQEAGVLEEHISMPNLCTCCNPKFLFSHRASKGKRGNLGAFLELLPA